PLENLVDERGRTPATLPGGPALPNTMGSPCRGDVTIPYSVTGAYRQRQISQVQPGCGNREGNLPRRAMVFRLRSLPAELAEQPHLPAPLIRAASSVCPARALRWRAAGIAIPEVQVASVALGPGIPGDAAQLGHLVRRGQ